MPKTPRRLSVAGILVALAAAIGVGSAAFAAPPVETPPSNIIVQTALKYEGTWQGQCWTFVQKVVFEATGREMGFDYRQGFFEGGAVEVSANEAAAGDIIQIADDEYTAGDADYDGLHTFIIITNNGDGTFDGIDSNSQYDEIVRLRNGYNPGAAAARYGNLEFHIYRFPTPSHPSPKGSPSGAAPLKFLRGDRAVVAANGDGLNLRKGAGADQVILTRLPDGTVVTITSEAPVVASGRNWVSVRSTLGDGWVAAEYLKLKASGTASGSGESKPILFRVFVPVLAISAPD
jgi:Bacterial SH3 domain